MKTVIEMARKTRLDVYAFGTNHEEFVAALKRFAELVRADEREACEMVCMTEFGGMGDGYDCAIAIRARRKT